MTASRQPVSLGELGDAEVLSIAWTDDDLLLTLQQSGLPERTTQLCFKSVRRLRVDFDYRGYVGRPLIFDADAVPVAGGGWAIRFEFGAAPNGCVAFECSAFSSLPLA